MRYADLNPDQVVAAIRAAFPTQLAKARLLVHNEITRKWREHQQELADSIPFYSEGDDGTEPQYDGMTLQLALMAVSEASMKKKGRL